MRALAAVALMLAVVATPRADAAVRAWVVPDRVALGDTTTLNVETDDGSTQPDFSVLAKDFELRGSSSSTQLSYVNGNATQKVLYAIVLEPREAGTFTIPSFAVGNSRSEPVALTVLPSLPGSAQRGDAVYLEAELDTQSPYVQQGVVYTIRLHYAVTLVDGAIDAPAPDAATITQLGQDQQYQQTEGGRQFRVLERRFTLVPERSGRLELPTPRFRGRALSGMDPFTRGGNVSATGPSLALDVKPEPANAPRPWLPVAAAALTRNDVPAQAQAGEPIMVEVTFTVDGVLSSQLADLELPPVPGAQVFPEPQQRSDALAGRALRATLRRRFAIVPNTGGRLEIPALRIPYWNTTTDRADVAELAPLVIDVAHAAVVTAPAGTTAPVAVTDGAAPASRDELRALHWWQGVSAALAVALVFALALLWSQSRANGAKAPAPGSAGAPAPGHGRLRRALAIGDLRDIAAALAALGAPPAGSPGALVARLDDAAQRAAVLRLEHTLWAGGVDKTERDATRAALRAAFRDGPKLASDVAASHAADGVLPPLYPAR